LRNNTKGNEMDLRILALAAVAVMAVAAFATAFHWDNEQTRSLTSTPQLL
jgi:hypothetical protein